MKYKFITTTQRIAANYSGWSGAICSLCKKETTNAQYHNSNSSLVKYFLNLYEQNSSVHL